MAAAPVPLTLVVGLPGEPRLARDCCPWCPWCPCCACCPRRRAAHSRARWRANRSTGIAAGFGLGGVEPMGE